MENKGRFKKGHKGGPGRPPILLPEVTSLIEKDKNAVRVTILTLLNLTEDEFQEKVQRRGLPMIERVLCQCIERLMNDGDVQKLRMLLEIPLGKLPEEQKEFDVSQEEKEIILEFRRRISEQRAISKKAD